MKTKHTAWTLALFAALMAMPARGQTPQGSGFTYQGQLKNSAIPVNGSVDLEFRLFPAPGGGTQVGTTQAKSNVSVVNGLFNVELDFGTGAFAGDARWLEVAVRSPAGGGTFTTLTPRQPMNATPYALRALSVPGGVADGHSLDAADGSPFNVVFVNNDGNVGIGTATPAAKMEIVGDWNGQEGALRIRGDKPTIGLTGGPITNNTSWKMHLGDTGILTFARNLTANTFSYVLNLTANDRVGIGTTNPGAKFEVAGGEVRFPGGTNPVNYQTHFNFIGDGRNYIRGETILADTGGNVGIGTGAPTSKLEIAAQDGLNIKGYQPFLTISDLNAGGARSRIQGAEGKIIFYTESSFVTGIPKMIIDNDGTTSVEILQILGGSDLAEPFDVADGKPTDGGENLTAEPGMVVVIDPARPGGLRLAASAYDTKVAGVISGAGGVNTGMVMGQKGSIADGDHPVALTGRVYVWSDASTVAIEPGDLLTTSETPGHAMKATDGERSHGAVLGKAMTRLEQGQKGLVLVLVSLQ